MEGDEKNEEVTQEHHDDQGDSYEARLELTKIIIRRALADPDAMEALLDFATRDRVLH
ncbi:hypothetical protein J2W17_000488 [Pseudomonas lini]|uniref:hypothetical protein n=1 Tax=Pseudomonas lini TaxID=163011 RepID=UPI00278AC550|nr:hypothetical protein [Pseudomonas lini]MDQ0121551.1 hypothetical protein [Pseudomonas lini]